MKNSEKYLLHYLTANYSNTAKWGILCTTVGYQIVAPRCHYPLSIHPDNYNFKRYGRILHEYQFVYIVAGSGYFTSDSCATTKVSAGTIIMLFPGERHTYRPDANTGWTEYWVGFKGDGADEWIRNGYFSPSTPLLNIGISQSILELYTNILEVVEEERTGYAVFIASIICHMLGEVYYKSQCRINTSVLDKINLARIMMRKNLHTNKTAEAIATDLGVSYSWFRKAFKENIGISPAQYQLQLKLSKAKELLTNTDDSISEIAYQLEFDSVSHFSLFFKTKEGVTASEFKKYARPKY